MVLPSKIMLHLVIIGILLNILAFIVLTNVMKKFNSIESFEKKLNRPTE